MLEEPPGPAVLARLPARRLAGGVLHRIVRRDRETPWWFASVPADADDAVRSAAGRFDLSPPDGTCYLATSRRGAALEAFQAFSHGMLPDQALRDRCRAEVVVPQATAVAAFLTAGSSRGLGVTQALWAGSERALTQRWATVLRRAGWQLLYHGLQHDPTGRSRGVSIFDRGGAHPPLDDDVGWAHETHPLHDDVELYEELRRAGLTVTRSDVQLTTVPLSTVIDPREVSTDPLGREL